MKYRVVLLVLALFLASCAEETTQPPNGGDIQPSWDANGNVQLAAPAPEDGIQIVIPEYEVPKGRESQRNYYIKLPSDVAVDIGRIQIAMNEGSHHLNIFRSDKARDEDFWEDSTFYATQSLFQESELIIEAQQRTIDWSTPEGVAVQLKAKDQLIVQIHYVNDNQQSTPNNTGKAIINLYKKKGAVAHRASMVFAQNQNVKLNPWTQDTTFTKICDFRPAKRPLHVIAMTGHFHFRGKTFVVERYDVNKKQVIDTVYQSAAWNEPPFKSFSGQGLLVDTNMVLRYVTTYSNMSPNTITFGPEVQKNEHSNLFLWYYPGIGRAIYDFTKD